MKFATVASLIGSAAVVSALPHAIVNSDDCTTTIDGHQHKRAVAVEYVYETVVVDSNGNRVAGTGAASTSTTVAATTATTSASIDLEEDDTTPVVHNPSAQTTSVLTSSVKEDTTSSTESAAYTTTAAEVAATSSVETAAAAATTSSIETSAAASTSTTTASTSTPSGSIYGDLQSYVDPTETFTDGTVACSSFPSGQGVIALDWLGFGGWSGIENSDGSTGGTCQEGSYCSYACQPGMSKTQWPESQPSSGVSIGGLLCKDGYLYKSSTSSDYLCEWGVDAAVVVSELSDDVAICRTDYPGTENMVIPTYVEGGSSLPLTVVDEDTYYMWEGSKTSAQYYVNNAGVTYEDGCIWGTSGSGVGNWAPMNFGAGYSDGISYLALIPNPNNGDALNFNVKIVAYDDDSVVTGDCYYENGTFSSEDGCTAAVTSGKAKFVLYN
ncbi:hypothetical protein KAFR_0J01640 [Kazachstania africana CBS 2517]|uniref:SUN4 n=1 Tax=Kazachstania africana (strain ATCC 22294 / BCRC 22015 / CBS 2517 / CECT 1963 / NBRC 1671 / NRRL Y-8276) TaxID=1071382 RepID=H2B0S9_KAZAF|nr:hypothetical protein KAFR_0J01640 [Kazachstania africana CBS 2517]CCF60229.1 hypothetical protein KAFR_0J01640 [Kazachstania africana CBS 2517]